MSLDIDLMVIQPTSVFSLNITHNLGAMAREVKYSAEKNDGYEDLTLYTVLWRPEECGFWQAKDIADLLDIGWCILRSDPDRFKKFNPENGWGDYDGLCNFVYEYRNACWDNPEAELRVSR